MKKQNLIRTIVAMALILSSAVYFTSCQKAVVTQTFDDAFSTVNIQNLNDVMQNANSLADLPEDFSSVELQIPEVLNTVQYTDLIAMMEKNIKLSDSEIDLLLQNDVNTYVDVVARMGSMPVQFEELNVTFTEIKNSTLSKYLLVQKQELDQYYIDDYYHSILELQSYMKDYVIQPLRNFNTIIENTPQVLKSATTDKSKDDKKKNSCVVVILKNKKDMDDAYEKKCKEEKEKKHKGSKGNNGNHYGNDK